MGSLFFMFLFFRTFAFENTNKNESMTGEEFRAVMEAVQAETAE